MKHIILVLLLFASAAGHCQGFLITADKPFVINRVKDTAFYGGFNRVKAFLELNRSEQDFLYWVNKMRADPKRFYQDYVTPFLLQFPEAKSHEANSLRAEMMGAPALGMLTPNDILNNAADDHAGYLARVNALSHNGEGNKSFQTRMAEAGVAGCAGEVIYSGKDDGLIALIFLLIDYGVYGLGHRKALLNPDFIVTGIAVSYMRDGTAIYVQDFSCSK